MPDAEHNYEYGAEHGGYSHMGIPPGCPACAAERREAATPALDDPAAILAGIRERGYRNGATGAECARLSDAAAEDIPALLAAVDAALKHHVEAVKYQDDAFGPYRYCKTCSGHPMWPCPEIQAITRELTGKESSDG